MTETVKTYLRPIDRDGLLAFAEKGRNNPNARGTNKVHTVMEGQYRSLSYVGDHAAVVVDEPLHLFGQNTAPAPGEIVLSAWVAAWAWASRPWPRCARSSSASWNSSSKATSATRQPGVRAAPRSSRPKWASRKCA